MKKKEDKKINKVGLMTGLGALLLFGLRYVPFYNYKQGWVNMSLSLNNGAQICSTPILNMVPACNWVSPLNIVVWVAIGVLAIISIYKLVKQ